MRVASPTRRLSTRSPDGGAAPPAGVLSPLAARPSVGAGPASPFKDRAQPFGQGLQIEGPAATGQGPEQRPPWGGERSERCGQVARLRDDAETPSLPVKIDPALGQGRHNLPLGHSRGSMVKSAGHARVGNPRHSRYSTAVPKSSRTYMKN